MRKFDLIIFDMDGLMLDTERLMIRVGGRLIEKYGYPLDEEFLVTMTGISDARMEPHFYKHFGGTFPFKDYLADLVTEKKELLAIEGVTVKKGLFTLLDYLEKNNFKKIVATSSNRDMMEKLFSLTGLTKYFTLAVCGDEVSKGKPDPEVFLKAAEKGQTPLHKCLVLEDSENGLLAAHKAGIPAVFIKDLIQPKKEVMDTVYKQCEDLSQVIDLL